MNEVMKNKHQVLPYQARTMLLIAKLPTQLCAETIAIGAQELLRESTGREIGDPWRMVRL